MARLAIRTDDFRLSFKLIEKLRSRNLSFEVIDVKKSVPSEKVVWFSTPSEIVNHPTLGTPIPVEINSIDDAILSALFQLKRTSTPVSLVIGVDPGPYPGVAWMVDGAFNGVMELTSVDEVIPKLEKLIDIAKFDSVVIRIGDGAPLIRDRIINDCIAENWVVEQVNETKTSIGLIRNNHSISALRIAANSGSKVWQTRDLNPSEGEIKYIQTESRKRSNGEITISKTTAMAVAKGELSMEDAIAKNLHHSSEE